MDQPPEPIALDAEAKPPGPPPALPAASPGWRDLLIAVAIIWAVELALGIALVIAAGGGDLSRMPLGLLAATVAGTAVTVTVSWVFACRKYGRPFAEGFSILRVSRRTVVWSVVLGAAAAVVAAIILSWAPEGDSLMTKLMRRPGGLAVLVVIALVLPPFEELYYRGFLYGVLARHLGGAGAVIVVAVWFGAAHVGQLAGDWIGVPIVFTMGFLWTVMRHRTGSLVPGILCHLAYNLGLVALSVASM